MESIRARYASRINGTYTNEAMTDVFKKLGLYNNDSSSLQSSNNANASSSGGDAAGGAFIGTRMENRLVSIAEALERAKRNH